MSPLSSCQADAGADPRSGDLLELLGLPPEKLERSRYAKRTERERCCGVPPDPL